MKQTLLGMTQSILSSMSSDEVNSISDTPESLQVAEILKTTFNNICVRAGLPEQKKMFQLDSSQNIFEPVLMFVPEDAKKIEWLKYYNQDPDVLMYDYVTILPLQQFVDYINGYLPTDLDTETMQFTVDGETFLFNYKTDHAPQYCTVVSDYYVIFDSYDKTIESTLQSSNTQCFGLNSPIWRMEDNFIPALDDAQFPLLLNEAKSLAYFELKQSPHVKAEQEAKRQWSSLQKDKSVDDKPSYFDQLPNFGRVAAYRNRGPFFKWH